MNSLKYIFREGEKRDLPAILELETRVFSGEQQVPADSIPVEESLHPRWFCVCDGDRLLGAIAGWNEEGKAHLGRFALNPDLRGGGLGRQLMAYAVAQLFASGYETAVAWAKDVSVHLLGQMGAKVTGDPVPFCGSHLTPIRLEKKDFVPLREQDILRLGREAGFDCALTSMETLKFQPEFRKYCAENLCGRYNANYSCPPDCGTPEEMAARMQQHGWALVMRSGWAVDYHDQPGVMKCKQGHNQAERKLVHRLRLLGIPGLMGGAGPCDLCYPCARAQGKPCPHPDMQVSCLSAYCLNVMALGSAVGLGFDLPDHKLALFGVYAFD